MSEEKPSKTSRKREAHALQALGQELTRQSSSNLDRLPLDTVLRDAVDDYGRLTKRLAQRRQLQFIGRLMREADADAIAAGLAALKGGSLEHKQLDRFVDQWRARLEEQGDAAITDLVHAHPQVDRQQLRALARQCVRAPKDEHATKALRRLLRELMDGSPG